MKDGLLSPFPRFARALSRTVGTTAVAVFVSFTPSAFGASKSDVALRVANLPQTYSDVTARALDFSPDGFRIAVQADGQKVNVWDWRHERIEHTVEKPRGGAEAITTNPLQYSPNGQLLAACHTNAAGSVGIRVWNVIDWSIAKDITDVHGGGCNAMSFTQNGEVIIRLVNRTGDPEDGLVAYATDTWQILWGIRLGRFEPISIAISPDGSLAAVGGLLIVVPSNISDPIKRVQQTTRQPNINIINLKQHTVIKVIQTNAMGPMAWSPDGTRLAVAGQLYVEILDPKAGDSIVNERLPTSSNMNVRYTTDGRYLIESDETGRGTGLGVEIWDGQRQKLLQHISVGDVGAIAVSRDGKYLAVGETGRTSIWQFK